MESVRRKFFSESELESVCNFSGVGKQVSKEKNFKAFEFCTFAANFGKNSPFNWELESKNFRLTSQH